MKRYTMSMADSLTHVPKHPDRTAYRVGQGVNFDIIYQEFPNRASMLKTIDMQESGPNFHTAWKDWTKSRMAVKLCPSPLHPKSLTELGW